MRHGRHRRGVGRQAGDDQDDVRRQEEHEDGHQDEDGLLDAADVDRDEETIRQTSISSFSPCHSGGMKLNTASPAAAMEAVIVRT